MESHEARSSWRRTTFSLPAPSLTSERAARPLAMSRQAITTRAPRLASSSAVIFPMPVLAPVTITGRLPVHSLLAAAWRAPDIDKPEDEVRAEAGREEEEVGNWVEAEKRLDESLQHSGPQSGFTILQYCHGMSIEGVLVFYRTTEFVGGRGGLI